MLCHPGRWTWFDWKLYICGLVFCQWELLPQHYQVVSPLPHSLGVTCITCTGRGTNKVISIDPMATVTTRKFPDSKVHGAKMGPIWHRQDPGGPHVAPKKTLLAGLFSILLWKMHCRTDSRLAPGQWKTSLQSNAVSHWLGANLKSALQHVPSFLLLHALDHHHHHHYH